MNNLNIENQWKVERDPFYLPLFKKHGFDYIKKAGFFFDENDSDINLADSLKILCTPLAFLKSVDDTKKSNVLVTSGSMCPINLLDTLNHSIFKLYYLHDTLGLFFNVLLIL